MDSMVQNSQSPALIVKNGFPHLGHWERYFLWDIITSDKGSLLFLPGGVDM